MNIELQTIQSKLYTLRGQVVMLDKDLAEMYGVETRVLNQAVKRNIERFPEDFMFQITKSEWDNMSSQFVTTSFSKRPKSALPLAFTEHGVTMLSAVLRSSIAIKVSIQVVRAFVAVKKMLMNQPTVAVAALQQEVARLKAYLDDVLIDQNDINEDTRVQLELINQTLAEMQVANKKNDGLRRPIGFIND